MTNIVDNVFPKKERTPVQAILDAARNQDLIEVVVIGWAKSDEVYFASTTDDPSLMLYFCEKVKFQILSADQGETE